MSYANNLNKKDKVVWEQFKRDCSPNNEQVIQQSISLGNCNVSISCFKGKLWLEIMPKETARMNRGIEGVIVGIDENACHVTSIMKMAQNANEVMAAKNSNKPIKVFTTIR